VVICSDNGPSSAGCGQADADIPQFSPHLADMGLFAGHEFSFRYTSIQSVGSLSVYMNIHEEFVAIQN
jgi:hypothetical protein